MTKIINDNLEEAAMNGELNGMKAVSKWQDEYVVRGWYVDSNGCVKTYGQGYAESFVEDTTYREANDEAT